MWVVPAFNLGLIRLAEVGGVLGWVRLAVGDLRYKHFLWGCVHDDDDRVQSSCVSEFHVVPGVGVNLEDAKAFVKQ